MPTTPSPRRRAPLTRERILRAAIRLADREGLDALSMRRLAAALKVEAMSLYNHVANKDDVLDGIVDLVVGEIGLPAFGGDWRESMRRRAHAAHEVMLRHPWAPQLVVSRITVGPHRLDYINATVGVLREAGFTVAQTDRAWFTLDSYIYGFTLQVLNFPISPDEYASAAAAYLPMIPAERYPHMYEMSKLVADGEYDGMHDFAFGLEIILEGLEQQRVRDR